MVLAISMGRPQFGQTNVSNGEKPFGSMAELLSARVSRKCGIAVLDGLACPSVARLAGVHADSAAHVPDFASTVRTAKRGGACKQAPPCNGRDSSYPTLRVGSERTPLAPGRSQIVARLRTTSSWKVTKRRLNGDWLGISRPVGWDEPVQELRYEVSYC